MASLIKKYYVQVSCLLAAIGTYSIVEAIDRTVRSVGYRDGGGTYVAWEVDSLLMAIGVGLVVAAAGTFINGIRKRD